MEEPTYTAYRFINQKTGNIIYEMMIADDIDHQEKLDKKHIELACDKALPFMDIYYEKRNS